MAWFDHIVRGLTEATSAVDLKYTDGFSRLRPSTGIIGLKLRPQQPEIR